MTSTQWLTLAGMVLGVSLKLACFLFGYLVIKIGAQLLRDGVKGEFQFKASLTGFTSDLASASPGLLFLLIGGFLIGYAMYLPKSVDYQSDNPDPPPAIVLPDK